MPHVFFQQFGNNRPEIIENPTYLYNTMILEISNNWPWVRWLMYRYREKILKEVDILERDWLDFIIKNNIDVEKYEKDSSKFIEDFLKK